ncbi:MAG: hypothetical protein V1918_04815 [Planctomycetota bacterium]
MEAPGKDSNPYYPKGPAVWLWGIALLILFLQLMVLYGAIFFDWNPFMPPQLPSGGKTLPSGPRPVPSAYRWRDIAGNDYAAAFCRSYSYGRADVLLAYDAEGGTFQGELAAQGLKPNFAYQVKLAGIAEGRPTAVEMATNERLGALGRWWQLAPRQGNIKDQEREQRKSDPAFAVQGYVLFDWFVTDEAGKASAPLALTNSLHVLRRTGEREPGEGDTAVRSYAWDGTAGGAYGGPPQKGEVRIYGEGQPGRPLPGAVRLPPGRYRALVVLTEESFHEQDHPLGGSWAPALVSEPVEFAVREPGKPSPSASPGKEAKFHPALPVGRERRKSLAQSPAGD